MALLVAEKMSKASIRVLGLGACVVCVQHKQVDSGKWQVQAHGWLSMYQSFYVMLSELGEQTVSPWRNSDPSKCHKRAPRMKSRMSAPRKYCPSKLHAI